MKYILMVVGMLSMVVIPFDGKNNTPATKNKLVLEKSSEKIIKEVVDKPILLTSDSICKAIGVPPRLIREIGENESGWRCIRSLSGGTDYGDLQVIDQTFNYWYDQLGLTGGKTRENYLVVGISYLKYNYDRYGSWEKARYAYARGHWKSPNSWTTLETKFMSKIDWTKYDK